MELFTYPITVEREGGTYYIHSENFLGVYGIGTQCAFHYFAVPKYTPWFLELTSAV